MYDSLLDSRIWAFFALLIVQVLVSVVYKCSQTNGKYVYSPLSAIASAEGIKLCMSAIAYAYACERLPSESKMGWLAARFVAGFTQASESIRRELTLQFMLYSGGLALLYMINNQLAFVLFLSVDMASIAMFKSFSAFIAASLLWLFCGRHITYEQWASIVLQVIGLCIVQYDACRNAPFLATKHYMLLALSTLITAVCSVINERLIKTHPMNIHLQNTLLYTFGFLLNTIAFMAPFKLLDQTEPRKSFFQGYSLIVLAVISCNSILGIAITFVYKYADAIVKTFSTACATGILLYLNVIAFHLKLNITACLGALVIFIASYLFLSMQHDRTVSPNDQPPSSAWKSGMKWKGCLFMIACISFLCYFGLSSPGPSTVSFSQNRVRIDRVRLYHPVMIEGTHLCSNDTKNQTRILINAVPCSPILQCSHALVSCRMQRHMQDRMLTVKNVTVTWKRSLETVFSTSVPSWRASSYWKNKDIVLVVHFNQPRYERLSLLRTYEDVFDLVQYTGPEAHPDVIECPDGGGGHRAYVCLSKVIELHPGHAGYLMVHFDLLPVLHNLENRSLESIWLPTISCVPRAKATGWWWGHPSGLPALLPLLNTWENSTNRHSINFRRNAQGGVCSSFSDTFYLPRAYIADWLVLTDLFRRHGVFLEIAFSIMTYAMIDGNASLHYDPLIGETFVGGFSLKSLLSRPSLHFIHRIDLAKADARDLIEHVIQRTLRL
jgi:hypothetical protein